MIDKQLMALARKAEKQIMAAYGGKECPDVSGYIYPVLKEAKRLGRESALDKKESYESK